MNKPKIQWFEGGSAFFWFKLLLAICVYIFVIEPLFFEYFIKKTDLNFLNGRMFSYLCAGFLFILCAIAGWVHGKIKKSAFTFSGSFVIFLTSYSIYLSHTGRYDLYPTQAEYKWPKYIYSLFLIPTTSWLAYIWLNFVRDVFCKAKNRLSEIIVRLLSHFKPVNKTTEDTSKSTKKAIQLNPDLSIKDLVDSKGSYKDFDFLGYYGLAEDVLDVIKSLSPKKAFSIGINGAWGSGKSSLIDILNDELIPEYNKVKEQQNKIRVISFSPWLYPDEKSLIANFFLKWKEEADDISLKMVFDDYASLLEDVRFGEMIVKIQNLFSQSKNLQSVKEKIEKHLKERKVNYLVIIDDLDRLEKKEILEVAKLSRVIADFPNTIYLLAYDRNYIDSILQDELKKGNSYFDKIIQVEYKLPQATEHSLNNYLVELITYRVDFITQSDDKLNKDELVNILSTIQELQVYQYFLPTIRDIKRFVNGFLLRYNSLRKKGLGVGFKEIFLLEMLFYKHKDKYEGFYNERNNIKRTNDLNGITQLSLFNGIEGDARNIVAKVLGEIFFKLESYQRTKLIEAYYSYFDNKILSPADIDAFMSKPNNQAESVKTYFADGHAYDLRKGYIEKTLSIAIQAVGTYYFKDLKEAWEKMFDIFNASSSNLKNKLSDEQEEDLSTFLTLKSAELDNQAQKRPTESENINRCNEFIHTLNTYYETFDPLKDNRKQYFRSHESADFEKFKGMDDSTYNRVLDLSKHSYEITLVKAAPQTAFWRFGFKLSTDNNFPIGRGFRHNCPGYPLFHIGKYHLDYFEEGPRPDKNNIRATIYGVDNKIIKDNSRANLLAFQPPANSDIKIKLSYVNNGIFVDIWEGGFKKGHINELPFKGYNMCKLYAWADNDPLNNENPYEFEIEIKEN